MLEGLPKRPKLAGEELVLLKAIAEAFDSARTKSYVGDDGMLETAPNSQRRVHDNVPCTHYTINGTDVTKLLRRGMAAFMYRGLSNPMQQSLNRSAELTRFPTADQWMLDEYVVLAPHVLNHELIERALDPEIPDWQKTPEFIYQMWDFRGFFITDKDEAERHYNIQVMVVASDANTETVGQYWHPAVQTRDFLQFGVRMIPIHKAIAFNIGSSTADYDRVFNPVMPDGRVVTHVAQIFSFVTPTGVVEPKTLDEWVPKGLIRQRYRGYAWKAGRVDCAREQKARMTRKSNDEVYNNLNMPFGLAMRSQKAFEENPTVEVYVSAP